MLKYDYILLEDVAMLLHKYISIYYVMLNYQVLITNKSQVKFSCWSKDGHNAHF